MHLADKVFDHLLGDIKIGNHTVTHGTNGFDIARRTPEHHFRFIANSQHTITAGGFENRHHRRLVQNNAAPLHIDERVRRSKIDGHIGRKHG